jgi:hypothetical protein
MSRPTIFRQQPARRDPATSARPRGSAVVEPLEPRVLLSCTGQEPDWMEPNNTLTEVLAAPPGEGSANLGLLSGPVTLAGLNTCDGTNDFYLFETDRPGRITDEVRIRGLPSISTARLLDEAGEHLRFASITAGGDQLISLAGLPPGRYVILVKSTVWVTTNPPPPQNFWDWLLRGRNPPPPHSSLQTIRVPDYTVQITPPSAPEILTDLTGHIAMVSPHQTLVPGDRIRPQIVITNSGETPIRGRVRIDLALQNGEETVELLPPLSVRLRLAPGKSTSVSFRLHVPIGIEASHNWRLRAQLDAGDAIHETWWANNTLLSDPFPILRRFGNFDGRRGVVLALDGGAAVGESGRLLGGTRYASRGLIQPLQLDAARIHEHIHYTFALRGNGSGEVEKTEEGFVIHLSGGDERTMVIARQKERIPKHFGPVARSNHITGLQVLPTVHIRAEPAWRWRIGDG